MTAIITSIVKNPSTVKAATAVGKAAVQVAGCAAKTVIVLAGFNLGCATVTAAEKGINKLKKKLAERKLRKMHQPESI
jgi:NADPH-dependent curcumin reductase CurA